MLGGLVAGFLAGVVLIAVIKNGGLTAAIRWGSRKKSKKPTPEGSSHPRPEEEVPPNPPRVSRRNRHQFYRELYEILLRQDPNNQEFEQSENQESQRKSDKKPPEPKVKKSAYERLANEEDLV